MSSRPPIQFLVDKETASRRLDHFLQQKIPGISRGSIQRLIKRGQVLVDGRAARAKGLTLQQGQRVLVAAASTDESPLPQPSSRLDLIASETDFVVLNKPAGIPCHPLVPGETDTLANFIVGRFPECATASAQAREGGLVHRLDWSTSGVMVAARNAQTHRHLRGLFSAHKVEKRYWALVAGVLSDPCVVDRAIEGVPNDKRRVQVVPQDCFDRGQLARTEIAPLGDNGKLTWVEATTTTGRRHQVRVHLASLGHPIAGDVLYGGPSLQHLEGAFLHASQLAWENYTFAAPLPQERGKLLQQLKVASDG